MSFAPLLVALFGPIGLPEMLIILVIIILIFGASRLPEIGKGIGQGIKNFKVVGEAIRWTKVRRKKLLRAALQDDPRFAHPPGHPLAVQPLQQRNRKLSRHAVPVLERRDVDRGPPGGSRGLQRLHFRLRSRCSASA